MFSLSLSVPLSSTRPRRGRSRSRCSTGGRSHERDWRRGVAPSVQPACRRSPTSTAARCPPLRRSLCSRRARACVAWTTRTHTPSTLTLFACFWESRRWNPYCLTGKPDQCSQRLVDSFEVGKHLSNIRRKDDNIRTLCVTGGVLAADSTREVDIGNRRRSSRSSALLRTALHTVSVDVCLHSTRQ